jgi:hypothetical protein
MLNGSGVNRLFMLALGALLAAVMPATAATRCDLLLTRLADQLVDAECFESTDLTTNGLMTTPLDNSLAGLQAGAFTPATDRAAISPNPPNRTPITKAIPGVQLDARIADDPAKQARILIRLPDQWNGKLVVAGASGTRSEFNGDFAWSDFVLQKGYAYVSQNKGVLNLYVASLNSVTPPEPLACRLNPTSTVWVHFYDNDAGQLFTRWTNFMIEATHLGGDALKAHYGRSPRRTYAVGTSNGGYQVRRALETAPKLFDGGVDWEGTYVDPAAPNLLSALPPAILNYPDYAVDFDPAGTAAKNILLAGYPPDLLTTTTPTISLWGRYSAQFWEVTLCQWQKRLDPTYDTYSSGTATYSYVERLSASDVGANLAAITTTGDIGRPLITVAGTMDALLPINLHARAYARAAAAFAEANGSDDEARHRPVYRLYEVQNGNHIETYRDTFPQLELIQPHAQRAFDLLVNYVEQGIELPPDQCIARGGAIASSPTQPGHCAYLFVP